ncbi:hypothetical protein MPSI1_000525 [Malassezia psittaci]|uniref:UTP23 sensor motif region domain-containing protein n=1 Tax=Malassezia psittaci TaxID=1821823 RepID=A0AAF0FBG2_9BASI|nr:hypothetical protein MPSI1_000525 [Malassezia psittaci]
MRQKRAKSYKRLVHQYVQDPIHQLANVLCTTKIKPMITQCCMVALYNRQKNCAPDEKAHIDQTIALAKQWERRKCNHREPLEPSVCIEQVVGPTNQHRYMLAADNPTLRRSLRRVVPGLPLLHYKQSVLILEPMSDLTDRHIGHMEANKSAIPASERKLLEKVSQEQGSSAEAAPDQAMPVKRKKPKAPNPLSVKKPKTHKTAPQISESSSLDAAKAKESGITEAHTVQQVTRRRKKRGRGGSHAESN